VSIRKRGVQILLASAGLGLLLGLSFLLGALLELRRVVSPLSDARALLELGEVSGGSEPGPGSIRFIQGVSLPETLDRADFDTAEFFSPYFGGSFGEDGIRGRIDQLTVVPEPGSALLRGLGLACFGRGSRFFPGIN